MPAAAAAAAEETLYRVKDLNAIAGPRRHEPVKGTTYDLSAEGDGTPMPMEHAVVFLRDKAFAVFNEKGQKVATMPQGATSQTISEAGGVKLAPGDTVARFTELTQTALMARVSAIPGGERMKKNTRRETLVMFLMEHAEKQAPKADEDRITDRQVEAMGEDQDALAEMIEAEGGL